jgi:ATP-dependent Lon protease
MSIGGTIMKVNELASTLQVCFDSGAKRVLLPMSSAADIATVPSDLFAKFQISFYSSPEDAVVKALGME